MVAPQQWVEVRAPAEQAEGTRSQLLRWLKRVGDRVSEHEPLIELETDKVTVEIPSPGCGVLAEILMHAQQEVAPGALLGRIEPAPPSEESRALPRQGAAVGADASASPPGPATRGTSGSAAGVPAREPARASATDLSPAVRRLLAENALDPASIQGSGEGGRLTVGDVMGAVSMRASAAGPTPPSTPAVGEGVKSHPVAHSPVRKRVAARTVESLLHVAPHVTTVFEADLAEVLAHRERHREAYAARGVALTLTAYFARAAVEAIRAVPEANSRWAERELVVFDTVNLGIATAAESGLLVPVLPHVESRDLLETARGINELIERARQGKLSPPDVRGGTFTISNHGVSGSLLAAPIVIHQPQSAILGVGRLEKRAVVIEESGGERIVARPRCFVTLTIDHRVMDGSDANRFMQAFCGCLSEWPR